MEALERASFSFEDGQQGTQNLNIKMLPSKSQRSSLGECMFIPRPQIDGWDGANALSVEDDVFRADAVLGAEVVPRGVDVGVQILL